MPFSSKTWLRSLMARLGLAGRRLQQPLRNRTAGVRLSLEQLENRVTPSVSTWDGGGIGNLWTTAGNWEGDVAPNPGDDLVFPASVPQTTNVNNFAAGTAFGSVLSGGSNYNITGSQVVLAGGVTAQGTNNTFGLNMQLSANAAFGQTQSGTLTIAGTIDLNGRNLTATTANSSGTTQFNSSISGTGNLTTGGSGQTVFTTSNSYTGSTAVTGGTLVVRHGGALGTADGTAATGTSLANNATLQLENSITVTGERLTSTTGGIVRAVGNDIWTGNVFFGDPSGASFQILPSSGASLRLSGNLTATGYGSLEFTDSGRTILDGTVTLSSTFTNYVYVYYGTLEVNGSLNQPLDRVYVYSGTLAGSGSIISNSSNQDYRIRLDGNATLSPGAASGTTAVLTLGNSVRFFSTNNKVNIDLNGGNVGTQYDQVNVVGDINLNNAALTVNLSYAAIIDSTYTIINNDGTDPIVGTFATLAEGSLINVSGQTLKISYVGGTGNDVVLTAVTGLPHGTVTSAAIINGNLVISDVSSAGKDDNLKISFDGTNYTIQDTTSPTPRPIGYININGATGNGTSTITVPAASFTGQILVNTQAGNDTLTVDFSSGNFSKAIAYDGGTQTTSDSLALTGGATFASVTHSFSSASAGTIDVTGNSQISYQGLEPVADNLSATNRVFTFTGGAETIIVSDTGGADGKMMIDSTLGESVTFTNPTGSLTINAGSGDDVVTIASVDSAFNAELAIQGDAGTDVINVNTDLTLGSGTNTGNLSLNAETINLNAASLRTDAGTNAGTAAFNGNIVLGTDVTIDTDGSGTDAPATFSGSINGARKLVVSAGSAAVSLQNVGNVTPLTSIQVNAAGLTLNGPTIAATNIINFNPAGNVTLAANLTATAGFVGLGILNADLASNNRTVVVNGDASGTVGNLQPVQSFAVTGGSGTFSSIATRDGGITLTGTYAGAQFELNNTVRTDQGTNAGPISIGGLGRVRLQSNTTFDTDHASGTDGNINVGLPVDLNLAASAFTLQIIAGSADASFTAAIGATNPLQGLTVTSADDFTAGSIALKSTGALSVTHSGTASTISGTISGSGATITKAGSGTLVLSGANTNSGATTVSTGTLALTHASNNNLPISTPITVAAGAFLNVAGLASSRLDLVSGQTLQGTGTVTGGTVNALSGSIIAPGTSPGILNTGSVAFNSGSTFSVEVNGTTAGTQHDQLNVTGTVNLGNATLNATGTIGATSATIVLINNDGSDAVTGTFIGLSEGTTVTINGIPFKISYTGGTGGNDVVLIGNQPPVVNRNNASVSTPEGTPATNTGTFGDAQGNNTVTITSGGIGTVTQDNAAGTWSWTIPTTDGPAGPTTVTITATDNQGATATTTFTYSTNNVAPTVTLLGSNTANEGQTKHYTYTTSDPGVDTFSVVSITASPDATVSNQVFNAATGVGSFDVTFVDGPNTTTVSVQVQDSDNANSNVSSINVAVANVAPTVTLLGSNTANEGQTKHYTYTTSDPGVDTFSVVSITASPDATVSNQVFNAATGAGSFDVKFLDGPNTTTVSVQVKDSDLADSNISSIAVAVANLKPTATANAYSTNQGSAVSGNVMTDGTPDSDPAGANDPLTVSSYSQPSNGTVTVAAKGSFTYTPDSTFAGTDSFTYTISDGDGGTATATVSITVGATAPGSILTIPDTCEGGTALLITGTAGNDHIVVNPGSTGSTLTLTINGVSTTVAKPTGRIIVTGGAGDDNIQIAGSISNTTWLYGDAGNDRIYGGGGASLMIGGDGNDQLNGGSGRDILVGGRGADTLVGNSGDDILLAGYTTKDDRATLGHEKFWCDVMKEWNSTNTFQDRVNNLRGPATQNPNANNGVSYLLPAVKDDDDIDMLQGCSGDDWFIYAMGKDKVVGQQEGVN